MLGPSPFPFFLLSAVLTNCFPVVAAGNRSRSWPLQDETVTADAGSSNGEATVDFPSATTAVSSLADVAFEAATFSKNVEEAPYSLKPREGSPEANSKNRLRRVVRPQLIAWGYFFAVSLLVLFFLTRYARALAAAEQVQPDEEEETVVPEPVAEAIRKKTPAVVADEARMARAGDLMALQHHAAALEALVGSAESKATLQQLQSAAKRTAEAKELALKAQTRALDSPDGKDKKGEAVEAEEAVKQLQGHRGEMVESSAALLQQAVAALGTRREHAAAAVQRIEKHAASIQQLFNNLQQTSLENNINGEHLRPHVELLQALQQQAKIQFDKLDSAWLNIVTVANAASGTFSPSLYGLSAELEAAAEAGQKMEGIDQGLKVMDSMAEAWAEGGTKAARNTATSVSAALRMWAADSFTRTEISMARVRGADIKLPEQRRREHTYFLAIADAVEKKLKDLLVEREEPGTPLSLAIRNLRNDDSVYRQLMRAGRETGKLLDDLYGEALPSIDKLDAGRQEEVRQMLLDSSRLVAEINGKALASLSLVPYAELESAAAKQAWERMNSEYLEAQRAAGEAWQALKDAEASSDLVVFQRKAQKAREVAILGILEAVGAVVRDTEVGCWLQLEKDIRLINSLTEGHGKEERIAADLSALRSEQNLSSAFLVIGKTLERELQSREAAMEALAERKIQPPTGTPGSGSDAHEMAFERFASTTKREMARKAQRVEKTIVEGLQLCRQLGDETPEVQIAAGTLREVQLKAAAAQAALRQSLGTLMQAKTKGQARNILKDIKAKKADLGEAVTEAKRVLEKLEAIETNPDLQWGIEGRRL